MPGCDLLGIPSKDSAHEPPQAEVERGEHREPRTPQEPDASATKDRDDASASPSAEPPEVQQLVVGETHSCVLSGGHVSCWGGDDYAQLGKTKEGSRRVEGLPTDVVELSAGSFTTCARTKAGEVHCWGRNDGGQLGIPTGDPTREPRKVTLPSPAAEIGVGTAHACARTTSGEAVCWGTTDVFGSAPASGPSVVPDACKATALGVAGLSTCVSCEGGTVECWGDASNGQLGDGVIVERGHRSKPEAVKGLSGIVELARVDFSGCGRKDDGTVWCWGWNLDYALGNKGPEVQPEAVQVSGVTAATSLWGRGTGYCVRQGDEAGTLCWGGNTFGELGDGTLVHRAKPTSAPNFDREVVAKASTGWHACASSSAGPISCWGRNGSGQLGNGQTQDSKEPQTVAVFGMPEADAQTFADAIGVTIRQGGKELATDGDVVDAAAAPFSVQLRIRENDGLFVRPSFSREPSWKASEGSGMSEAPGNPDRDLLLRPEGNHYWSPSSQRFDGACETNDGWAVCARTVDVLDTPGGVLASSAWGGRSLFLHFQSKQGFAPSRIVEVRFAG